MTKFKLYSIILKVNVTYVREPQFWEGAQVATTPIERPKELR